MSEYLVGVYKEVGKNAGWGIGGSQIHISCNFQASVTDTFLYLRGWIKLILSNHFFCL